MTPSGALVRADSRERPASITGARQSYKRGRSRSTALRDSLAGRSSSMTHSLELAMLPKSVSVTVIGLSRFCHSRLNQTDDFTGNLLFLWLPGTGSNRRPSD